MHQLVVDSQTLNIHGSQCEVVTYATDTGSPECIDTPGCNGYRISSFAVLLTNHWQINM